MRRLRTTTFLIALGLALVGAGCGGDGDTAGSSADATSLEQGDVDSQRLPVGGDESSSAERVESAAGLPDVSLDIIKTAEVEMAVTRDGLDDAMNRATAIAGRYGGFVLSSSTSEEDDDSAALTVRVPSERFEAAVADIKDLGDVRSERVTGEDVGQEFIDLRARLRNWRGQEVVLLRLYDEADTIDETIRVQDEVARVQLEIEQIQGRLNFLEDQTALGTITASFTTVVVPPEPPGRFARAWQQAVEMMTGVTAVLITSLGLVIPLAVLALLTIVAVRTLRPRLKPGEL